MAIHIDEVEGKAGIEKFVDTAFDINLANPLWTPPIRKQERELLSPDGHPFWEYADRKLFVARIN